MLYTAMKKLIMNENSRVGRGEITQEEHGPWRAKTQDKLDVFYAKDRLTKNQYEELTGMLTA